MAVEMTEQLMEAPTRGSQTNPRPIKIIRLITRLNIGGPAQQAVALTSRLNTGSFQALLVTGLPEQEEGDLRERAQRQGVCPLVIPQLRRAVHPWDDAVALAKLIRLLLRERPTILHTHMAKAGTLGRLAGLCYRWRHPSKRLIMIHTFHGHVFHGYFGPLANTLFVHIERWLAKRTDRLIAVSETVRAELLRYKIGRPDQIIVIPVGLALEPLLALEPHHGRAEPFRIGVVGRLVPIKNHHMILEAVARLVQRQSLRQLRCAIVGDGELRPQLEREALERRLQEILEFHGWQFDLPRIYEALDCVCLSSLNEGTPLSLIEAMAAARPVIATDVGGVRDLLGDAAAHQPRRRFCLRERGLSVASGDAEGLAEAIEFLAAHPELQRQLGHTGRAYILSRFTTERLLRDVIACYNAALGVPSTP